MENFTQSYLRVYRLYSHVHMGTCIWIDPVHMYVIQLQGDPDLIQIQTIHHGSWIRSASRGSSAAKNYLSALAGNSPSRPHVRKSLVVLCDCLNWLDGE